MITEKEPIQKTKINRIFTGVVISDKMDKTIVVQVDHFKMHPRYHKRCKVSKKFKVNNPGNKFKVGAKVSFVGCRPLSKDKKWTVLSK
ncbi:MAG TPA: 30S ribosomal protein S17 [bacterium]|nr:30S ribosomal protein S17 [bacterium]